MFKLSAFILAIFFIYTCNGQVTSSAKNLDDLIKEVTAIINANKDAQFVDLVPKMRDQTQAAIDSMKKAGYTPTQDEIKTKFDNFVPGSDTVLGKDTNALTRFKGGITRHLNFAFGYNSNTKE